MRQVHPAIILLILLCFCLSARAKPLIPIEDSESTKKTYLKLLDEYRQKSCRSDDESKFDQLFKAYRADGYYVPTIGQNADLRAIRQGLKPLSEKLKWISKLKDQLPTGKRFPHPSHTTQRLKKRINVLLNLKKEHLLTTNNQKKHQLLKRSRQEITALKKDFGELVQKVPFLLNFHYPVDHYDNRYAYEQAKAKGKEHLSNTIYIKRKVFEDGAYTKAHTQPDMYLRTTLDTIGLQLKNQGDLLSENLRYDLEWALKRIEYFLRQGRQRQVERLSEWQQRTKRTLEFYQALTSKNPNVEKIVKKKLLAADALKHFVLNKHVESYLFWSQQSPIYQALFVLDQILLNEAGRATSRNELDRKDIAQVVLNRYHDQDYASLPKDSALYSDLTKGPENFSPKNFPWLNVMFKPSEFSFTLHFFPAVRHVFCPDYYHIARRTRGANLDLAMDLLQNPADDFKALRYFSRFSMTGKIDITPMWTNYQRLPERPGERLASTRKLKRLMKNGLYRFLYAFTAPSMDTFHVLELAGRTYAVKNYDKTPAFYSYRDPHKFAFFERRE